MQSQKFGPLSYLIAHPQVRTLPPPFEHSGGLVNSMRRCHGLHVSFTERLMYLILVFNCTANVILR